MGTLISVLNLLQINKSVFSMLVIFIGTYWLMKVLMLDKLSKLLVERDHRLEGRVDSAEKFYGEANELKAKIQVEMRKAHAAASQRFAELKTSAQEKHRIVLQAAKETSLKMTSDSRVQVAAQIQNELKKTQAEIPALAKLMVEQILRPAKGQQRSQALNQGL